MVGYGDVRRWQPGPLDGAEQQLKARSDTLPWLADELSRASKPNGWHGLAADAAAVEQARLADGMEHIVAGVAAARTALMAASDGVTGLKNLVSEADGLAQAHGLSVSDAGEVMDPGLPPDVPAEQADAVRLEREKIKAELLDRVQQILTRAAEIDDSLADVLGRIERGEIHDGGATSLAAAAEAGAAQGITTPEIPGPPPNPPTDPGAGEHGSDPWYTRGDDLLTKDLANTAAMFADGIGWTHASAHLRRYLDNSGTDLTVSPDEMMRDVDRFRGEVDKTTAAEMHRIAAEAEANGTYGKPTQFSSEWKGEYIGPEDSKDWILRDGRGPVLGDRSRDRASARAAWRRTPNRDGLQDPCVRPLQLGRRKGNGYRSGHHHRRFHGRNAPRRRSAGIQYGRFYRRQALCWHGAPTGSATRTARTARQSRRHPNRPRTVVDHRAEAH